MGTSHQPQKRRLSFSLSVAILAAAPAASAVSPLVTDDADTVELRHLQLNAGWQFSRAGSARAFAIPTNPVLGVSSRAELGATFGYLSRVFDAASARSDAEGVSDLTLAAKWRLWATAENGLRLSARLDLKLPTASGRRGLGTGHTDVSAVLIATRCWGATCLDWNLGYSATDVSGSVFGNDIWFAGQAVRRKLTERWALIGETYGQGPFRGSAASFNFSGGAQFMLRESFLFSALVGSAAGHNAPDATGYLGFSWVF